MKNPEKKTIIKTTVTSFTAFLFLMVGITGILMFFHIFDDYTKVTHEILAIIFFLFSICHLIVNWKIFKRYFKKQVFLTSGVIVFLFALLLIFISKNSSDLQRDLIEKLLRSHISHSFIVINKSFDKTKAKLECNGIMIGESNTIEEISIKNQISPQEIIELIMQ
jgi:hypothetical protein